MKSIIELAKVLGTTSMYLLDEDSNTKNEDSDLSTTEATSAIKNPSFVREGDFFGSGRVLMYEDKGKRYVFPATKENQAWFRELVKAAITGDAVT